MKPFSSLKYFIENKKRSLTIIIILFLSVAVVSFITSLVTSIIEDAKKANLNSYKSMSVISPISDDIFIKDEVIEIVSAIPEIKYIINGTISYTHLNTTIGSTSSTVFYPNNKEDINILMKEAGLKLIEGRLPAYKDEFEIVMHEKLLQNKKLKIGDAFGSDVDDNEWLSGKYIIVGVLQGEPIISFANKNTRYEAYRNSGLAMDKPIVQVLIPKEGQLSVMNEKIEAIGKKQVSYTTYDSLKEQFDIQIASMSILLSIIIVVVVFIVSISISALIYIVYMNRSDEFGILNAMGYRKSFIKALIIKELTALSVFSWAGGYLFSWLLISLINYLLLNPKGQSLYFFTTLGLVNTLIIPVMVTFCATYPILKKLKRWDPISVIERRD